MDNEVRQKITRARSQLVLHKPFFGYLSCYLEPKEDKNLLIPTMGTDGKFLYYNPDWVRELDMEHLQGVLAHEVFHAAFSHIFRRGAREPIRWNLAADCIANVHLLAEGFKLPSGGLMGNASHSELNEARKLSVEEAYEKIKLLKDGGKGKRKGGSEDKGDGEGKSKGKGTISLPSGDSDLGGDLLDDHDVWDRAGDEKGELEESAAKKELEQRWREYVSRARQIAKSQGKGMGSLDEEIDELLEPRMNWREYLRNFILSSIMSDYQICPPNKRHIWRNIYLPSPKKGDEVEVAFICDTSGSMDTDEIRDALSEVRGICEQFEGFRIWYVECDWDIQGITELTPYTYNLDEIKKVKGRGGTRFPVARIMEQIQNERGGNPSAIIYFTDGYGDTEGFEPGCPVIWLVCKKDDFKPPFGNVVKFEARS